MKQSAKSVTFTGLAGAVAVAGASQAYGTIINVQPPSNITGQASTSASVKEFWNVDTGTTAATNAAGSDVEFGYFNSSTEFFTGVYGLNGGKAAAYQYGAAYSAYAYSAAKGQVVGTGGAFKFNQYAGRFTFMTLYANGSSYNSLQATNTPQYLGFQFTAADGLLHDGWVELESDTYSTTNPGGLKFIAAAYNSVADTAGGTIVIGQVGTNAVPEPGTLSALALGAAGLAGLGLKRRRQVALASQA